MGGKINLSTAGLHRHAGKQNDESNGKGEQFCAGIAED
jgi:hypothetical protein